MLRREIARAVREKEWEHQSSAKFRITHAVIGTFSGFACSGRMGSSRGTATTEGTKKSPKRETSTSTYPRYQTQMPPNLHPDTHSTVRPVVLQLARTRSNPLQVIVSPSPERRCRRSSLSPARMRFPTVQNELAHFYPARIRVESSSESKGTEPNEE